MLGAILNIMLIILKILGILLLSALLLVIFLLLIVLFVPIRYKSSGDFQKNENGVEHHIFAKVTWCLRVISIGFQRTDNKNNISFKIFGFDLLNRKKKPKKQKGSKKLSAKTTVKEASTNKDKNDFVVQKKDVSVEQPQEKLAHKEMITDKDIDTKENETLEIKDDIAEKEVKKQSVKEKIATILNKIKEKLRGIAEKIKAIADKVKKINNVKNSFIEYLKRETSKKAIKEIKNIIFKLIKRILPRKLKATVGFGFKDPSSTGKALGYASIFYGIYGENLELEPDFDNEVLYVKYMLKGRIRLIHFLLAGLKLYRNKWIRESITFSKEIVKEL